MMSNNGQKILIMAGGTGGHIFPALSIAEKLQSAGAKVEWMGAIKGLEVQLIGQQEIPLHLISVTGLRGKGLLRLTLAPFMIIRAVFQAVGIMRSVQPDCVLGMGGFVTGPGGVAAKLTGRKLVIHEQNAVPGITNKLLSIIANKVLEAFPGTFRQQQKVDYTGNPVRKNIVALGNAQYRRSDSGDPLHVLVLGGSQGAVAVNQIIPNMLASWKSSEVPHVIHQTGSNNLAETIDLYRSVGIEPNDHLKVKGFIDEMAEVFEWADVVICRSGASTVCELAVAGLPSILIPYPYHKDNQQTKNAQWLSNSSAAILIQQSSLTLDLLMSTLSELDEDRSKLDAMAIAARRLANSDASTTIADYCLEVANG